MVEIDYGDGTPKFNSGWKTNKATGSVNHTYNNAGTYSAKVTGKDSNGKTETITVTITVQ